MSVSEDAVREKLKNVIDPELFVNVVDLGLIYAIKLNRVEYAATSSGAEGSSEVNPPRADGSNEKAAAGEAVNVHIDMTMTSPACPAGPQLIEGAKREVRSLENVHQVEVRIVLDPPWTPDRMTEDAKDQLGIF